MDNTPHYLLKERFMPRHSVQKGERVEGLDLLSKVELREFDRELKRVSFTAEARRLAKEEIAADIRRRTGVEVDTKAIDPDAIEGYAKSRLIDCLMSSGSPEWQAIADQTGMRVSDAIANNWQALSAQRQRWSAYYEQAIQVFTERESDGGDSLAPLRGRLRREFRATGIRSRRTG